jgi:TetR/AcrR family transcriptional regulator, tetracycline repressor protein
VALELSAREGVGALSMRRIAAELGTGAMSLYNHVPDKAALLRGLADRLLDDLEIPLEGTWRHVARTWATSLRSTLLAHPFLVGVLVAIDETQPLATARRGLVEALQAVGLEAVDALVVMRAVGRYVTGSVIIDNAYLRAARAERDQLDEHFAIGLDALLDGIGGRLGGAPGVAVATAAQTSRDRTTPAPS